MDLYPNKQPDENNYWWAKYQDSILRDDQRNFCLELSGQTEVSWSDFKKKDKFLCLISALALVSSVASWPGCLLTVAKQFKVIGIQGNRTNNLSEGRKGNMHVWKGWCQNVGLCSAFTQDIHQGYSSAALEDKLHSTPHFYFFHGPLAPSWSRAKTSCCCC